MSGWSNWDSGWVTHEQVMNELVAAINERYPSGYHLSPTKIMHPPTGWQRITCLESIMELLSHAITDWYVPPIDFSANLAGFTRLSKSKINELLDATVLWSLPRPSDEEEWLAGAKQMRQVIGWLTFYRLSNSKWVNRRGIASFAKAYDVSGDYPDYPAYSRDDYVSDFLAAVEPMGDSIGASGAPGLYVYNASTRPVGRIRGSFATGQLQKERTGFSGILYLYGCPFEMGGTSIYMPEVFFDDSTAGKFDLDRFEEYTLLTSATVGTAKQIVDAVKSDAAPTIPANWDITKSRTYAGFEFDAVEGYIKGDFEFV